jgi:hypothetical protein
MEQRLIAGAMTREARRIVREAGRSRSMAASVRVGDPDGEHVTLPEQHWYDAGARVDLVVRALEALGTDERLVWRRRTGDLDVRDGDWAWLAAARAAFSTQGVALERFHVVTRHGWHELVTGARVEWSRLRDHQV